MLGCLTTARHTAHTRERAVVRTVSTLRCSMVIMQPVTTVVYNALSYALTGANRSWSSDHSLDGPAPSVRPAAQEWRVFEERHTRAEMAVIRTYLLTLLALTVLLTSGISGISGDANHPTKNKPDFCPNVAEEWKDLKDHLMSQRWGETSFKKLKEELKDHINDLSRRGEFSLRYTRQQF